MYKLIFKITLIISLLLHSMGQPQALRADRPGEGYALRPASTRHNGITGHYNDELINILTDATRFLHNARLKSINSINMMFNLSISIHGNEIVPSLDEAQAISLQINEFLDDARKTFEHFQNKVIPDLVEMLTKSQLSVTEAEMANTATISLYKAFCSYFTGIFGYDASEFLIGKFNLLERAKAYKQYEWMDGPLYIPEVKAYCIWSIGMDTNKQLKDLLVAFGFSEEAMDIWFKVLRKYILESIEKPLDRHQPLEMQIITVKINLLRFWVDEVFSLNDKEMFDKKWKNKNDVLAFAALGAFFEDTINEIDSYVQKRKLDPGPESQDFKNKLMTLDDLVEEAIEEYEIFLYMARNTNIEAMRALIKLSAMPITHPGFVKEIDKALSLSGRSLSYINQIDAAA